MPIGEIIGELILRPILELIFYGLSYWTGFSVLKSCSLGRMRLAPLDTILEKNRSKRKWFQIDWSIWLELPRKGRFLKAECVCLVGMVVGIGLGVGVYFLVKNLESSEGGVVVAPISRNHHRIAS